MNALVLRIGNRPAQRQVAATELSDAACRRRMIARREISAISTIVENCELSDIAIARIELALGRIDNALLPPEGQP